MIKFNIIHKIRFDRGRIYYSYFTSIITAALVRIFTVSNDWRMWVLSGVLVFALIYIFGWIDDKLKIINSEQQGYAEKNPAMLKILKELEEIKSKLVYKNLEV